MMRRRAVAVAAPSRFPIAFVLRLLRGILILGFVLFLVLGGTGAILTYRVVTTHNDTETVTPASYLLSNYITLNFTDAAGGEHDGWLLLGIKGAPTIIMCHGYNSNRSDLLSLGTILRDNHYNVYLFNFSGPKAREGYSNLGTRQAADVMKAIETVTKQTGVNSRRVGLFGTNLGGYAAMVAALQNTRVKALAVDTIYDSPDQMFETQIDQQLGGSSPAFRFITDAEFHLSSWGAKPFPVRGSLSKLENTPKLLIVGRDSPALATITEDLYSAAPQPKRMLIMEHSLNTLASAAEKQEYENQVLDFFLQNLSLRAD